MAAPAVLGYGGAASATHRLIGPIAAGLAFIAVWGHLRPLRWANLPLGGMLLVVPWPFAFGEAATLTSLVVGLILITLALIRGPVRERFGGGWTMLWRGTTVGDQKSKR